MDKTQTARIDLAKIPVRKLSLHHMQRALTQRPVVRWHPPPADVEAGINSGNRQNHGQNRRAHGPAFSLSCGERCCGRIRERDCVGLSVRLHLTGFANSHLNAQVGFRRLRRALLRTLPRAWPRLVLHLPSSAASRRRASVLPWFSCRACRYSARAAAIFPLFCSDSANQ